MSLYIAYLPDPDGSGRLDHLLQYALADAEKKTEIYWLDGADEFCRAADSGQLEESRILFAAEADPALKKAQRRCRKRCPRTEKTKLLRRTSAPLWRALHKI